MFEPQTVHPTLIKAARSRGTPSSTDFRLVVMKAGDKLIRQRMFYEQTKAWCVSEYEKERDDFRRAELDERIIMLERFIHDLNYITERMFRFLPPTLVEEIERTAKDSYKPFDGPPPGELQH